MGHLAQHPTAFPAHTLGLGGSRSWHNKALCVVRTPRASRVWIGFLAACAIAVSPAEAQAAELHGHIKDESGAPVGGAHVAVRPSPPPSPPSAGGPWQTDTDPDGAFSVTLPSDGDYLVDVQRQGYYQLLGQTVHIETSQEVTLTIDTVREVFQSVDVSEQPSPVDITQTQNEERLTGTEINDVLYPNSHSLVDSVKMMPGVLVDSGGGLHFNGSTGDQVEYLLNGFNIANPVSGQFNTALAVEGIRSVDYSSGRYSPEFGKGSAGVLAINTESGTDNFHFTATDFIPGIDIQQGVRLGNWYPRIGISGPIKRGKAWFSDTLGAEYNNTLVTGLPSGQNTSSGWNGYNLLHAQWNLSPRNIVIGDFMINRGTDDRFGLGVLDPVSTTQTVHTHEYFASAKDQVYLGNRSMIQFGYAHNDFFTGQTPQGDATYVYGPQGRSGNYFVTGTQQSSRDEALVQGYVPQFHLLGTHQIQAGLDTDLLHYNGNFSRTSYEVTGFGAQILSETTFTGSGVFHVRDAEAAPWILDTWRAAKRLQIEVGARQDWDRRVDQAAWSPRASFSWAPFASGLTRISGGYSVAHDAVALAPFGMVLDQTALTTTYNANGTPEGPPAPSSFTLPSGGLRLPTAANWSLNLDRQITSHLFAGVKYLRRRGTDGFDFVNTLAPNAPPSVLPLPGGAEPGVYQLENLRRDDYDSVQVAVHQTFSGQYEWMVSYTRSSALSNAVLNANSAEPLQVLPNLVPMPWDAPNRLMGWAYLPVPFQKKEKKWAIAALVDARSGFPFSVQQQTGIISGAVDSYRYPFNFDLNLAIERMVTLHGLRFALRLGVDNLTDSRNPTAVENVIGAANYLQFLGDEGRHFVVRIRFFGRAGTK